MPRKIRIQLSNYLPHQQRLLTSKHRETLLVSGFGAGKTHVLLRMAFLLHATKPIRRKTKSRGWVVYPTYDLARELFFDPFCEILNELNIKHKARWSLKEINTPYGDIMIKSMQHPEKLIGSTLSWAAIDEFDVESFVRCHEVWVKTIARLRGCNEPQIFITTTPEGFGYTHKLFVEDAERNKQRLMIKARTTDNPYLPESYIENLRASYDPKLLDQYMNGEFVNLAGDQAYYAFDRELHMVKLAEDAGNRDAVHIGMDFNVDPMTATVLRRDGAGYCVVDEIWLRNSNTERMCEVIEDAYPGRDVYIYPDWTGVKRVTSAASGITDIAILKRHGFIVKGKLNPRVKDRINTVNNAFSKNLLTISEKCSHLVKDLERVVRDQHGELDKSSKDLTHISDALGYALTVLLPIYRARYRA